MTIDLAKLSSRKIERARGGKPSYPTWTLGEGENSLKVSCQLTAEVIGFLLAGGGGDKATVVGVIRRVLKGKGITSQPKDSSLSGRVAMGGRQAAEPFQKIPHHACQMVQVDEKTQFVSSKVGRIAEHLDGLLHASK